MLSEKELSLKYFFIYLYSLDYCLKILNEMKFTVTPHVNKMTGLLPRGSFRNDGTSRR